MAVPEVKLHNVLKALAIIITQRLVGFPLRRSVMRCLMSIDGPHACCKMERLVTRPFL